MAGRESIVIQVKIRPYGVGIDINDPTDTAAVQRQFDIAMGKGKVLPEEQQSSTGGS